VPVELETLLVKTEFEGQKERASIFLTVLKMSLTKLPSSISNSPVNVQRMPELQSESLYSLCRWWESTHTQDDPLPHICHEFTSPDKLLSSPMAPPMQYNFARVASGMLGTHRAVHADSMPVEHALHGAGRSLGLVGISLGVLFILLIIAAISCIRRRKTLAIDPDLSAPHTHTVIRVQAGKEDSPPPDYSTVIRIKEEEEEEYLPSYRQAVASHIISGSEEKGDMERIGDIEKPKGMSDRGYTEWKGNTEDLDENKEEEKHGENAYVCSNSESLEISIKHHHIS